jgi:signal transduction histidine kinase
MIERARERLDGLLQLINDWLDMNRIQTGDIVHRLRSNPLAPCVESALAGLEMTARETGITICVDLPSDLPDVCMDPDTFREALSNLIANAIKYNRPEGRVCISAREQSDWVVVAVEDTGLGMDEKEIPFIFEQFYRSKNKEVRRRQGTGLGLTIVQKVVRAHCGKIEVLSRPGEGSTFSVYLNKGRED